MGTGEKINEAVLAYLREQRAREAEKRRESEYFKQEKPQIQVITQRVRTTLSARLMSEPINYSEPFPTRRITVQLNEISYTIVGTHFRSLTEFSLIACTAATESHNATLFSIGSEDTPYLEGKLPTLEDAQMIENVTSAFQ